MNKVLVTFPSVLLAIFCAACGDDSGTVAGGTGGMGASPGAGGMGTSGIGGMGTGGTAMPGAGGTATPGAGGGTVTPGAGGGTVTPGAGGGTVTPGAGGGTVTPGAGGGTVTPGAGGGTVTPGAGGGTVTPGAGGGGNPGTGGGDNPSTGGGDPGSGGAATGGNGGEATGGQGTGGVPPVSNPQFVSTAQGAEWQEGTCTEATGNAEITANDGAGGQTWEGFGAAFNEIGWSVLTDGTRDEAIELLFGTDGCNFTWGRIPMGASDYGMDRYTLDDTAGADNNIDPVPNGESNRPPPDTSLSKFSFARDEQKLIPYIKAALAVKPDLKFWASPWTPPVWMKTGYKTNSGADSSKDAVRPSFFDGGTFNATEANLTAYAEYYKKFVQGYKDNYGINISMVSPQNEPGYDQNYPSCLWQKADYVKWIGQYLGPAMQNMGVEVMLGSLSNANTDIEIANGVVQDGTAKSLVSVVGVQWNVLASVNNGQSFGGLPVWGSEHKCGNYPWGEAGAPPYDSQKAPNDHAYGVESWGYIRDAITKGKVTSYNAWNMVLDSNGLGIDTTRDWKQNALLVAGGSLTKTHAYYVFRHFSQFVVPGAKVVSATGSDTVAFKNPDGSFVAVVYNSGGAKSSTISIGGKTLQCQLPGDGWATVNVTP